MSEKILIVDDDLDTLKLVGLMLQRQGYEILAASNGAQGLEKASSEHPDLILLDVMMPDMDGYEVTRRLRSDPAIAHIPIIMFTAKTLVDDKVAGFEAGADDYLTKPTHPAELTAHVKAVLARASTTRGVQAERGRVLGFIGARGGLGTTTLATNVAASLARDDENVILADLTPGRGSVGLQLGFTRPTGLASLLSRRPDEINTRIVEGQIVTHASGVRLLLASYNPAEAALINAAAQIETTIRNLATMCRVLVLDLGTGLPEAIKRVVTLCNQIIIPIEPNQIALAQTEALISELQAIGVGPGRIEVVLMNRARSSLQLTVSQIEERLNHKILAVVSPAPELAYQANEASSPMVIVQPDSLTAGQFSRVARRLFPRDQPPE